VTSETSTVSLPALPRASPSDRSARRARASRSSSLRTAIEESLGLFLIGGVCCFLAAYYFSSGAKFGQSRLPIWELFVALGVIGLVGGFLSLAAEDEVPSVPRRAAGRPIPQVVLAVPGEFEGRPELETLPELEPLREESTPHEPPADLGETDESVPLSEGLDREVRSSVDEALAELDGVERSLIDRPPLHSRARPSMPLRPDGVPAVGESSPRGRDRSLPDPDPGSKRLEGRSSLRGAGVMCGGCGREVIGPQGAQCPGCGSPLCATCWEGFDPPPCPECAVVRRVR
jgi:hypothetical protein